MQIVPFGDEDNIRTIHTINISNVGLDKQYGDEGYYNYVVEKDAYKAFTDDTLRVTHKREDGPIRLVGTALMALDDFG